VSSADITVVPTGGSSAIDLADLAAAVLALQAAAHSPQIAIWAGASYSSGGDSFFMNVAKQTGVIENLDITIDGSPVTTGTAVADLPDGLYGYTLNSVPSAPGTHTVEVTGETSGATTSTTYTV
jgi:hypothetical protein